MATNMSLDWDNRAQSLSDRIKIVSQNLTCFSNSYLNKTGKKDYALIKELFARDLIMFPYHFTCICLEYAVPKDPFDPQELISATKWCRLFIDMAIAYNLDFCIDELMPLIRISAFIHDPIIKQVYKDVFRIFIKNNISLDTSLANDMSSLMRIA